MLAALSTFSFDIKYHTGKQNQDADGLSKRPHEELINESHSQKESQRIHEFTSYYLAAVDAVKATCQYHTVRHDESSPPLCLLESLAILPDAVPSAFEEDKTSSHGLFIVPKYNDAKLSRLLQADPSVGSVIKSLESGESFYFT